MVVAPIKRERDFDKWRGQLKGKIVMVTLPDSGSEPGEAAFKRYSNDELAKLDQYQQPTYDPAAADRRVKRLDFAKKLDAFLKSEGAVAYATESRSDGKLVHGEGYLFGVGDTQAVPGVEIAAEDYRRLARLAKIGAGADASRSTATSASTTATPRPTTSSPKFRGPIPRRAM